LTASAAKLDGISASELNATIANAAKLTGISATELGNAIAAIPRVGALCTRTATLTTQSNALLTVLGGLGLGGTIPPALTLTVPALPAPLSSFACP
jgi:hypothetical protein